MQVKYLIIAIVSVLILSAAGFWVFPAWQSMDSAKVEYHKLQGNLRQAKIDNELLEADCHNLTHDDRLIEKVARDKFGWCRDKEKIYDFSGN